MLWFNKASKFFMMIELPIDVVGNPGAGVHEPYSLFAICDRNEGSPGRDALPKRFLLHLVCVFDVLP